ncbi:MAG: hypothetical protein ACJ76I_07010 [Gaiellaceae bacterium]
MDDLTRKRLEHNEQIYRAINEEIDEASIGNVREYVCECAHTTCDETIRLTRDQYRAIRTQPDRYVLVPGHQLAELEDVVRREPGYLVVDKG